VLSKKVIFPLLLLLSLFSLLLAGCSTSSSPGQTKDTGRTIQHAMGQTKVPTHPKRVVVLTNEGIEACLALGVKPVGAVKGFTGHPWYPHLSKELKGVTIVGDENQPNLETIASLKPDLIIGNKMRQEKIYDQLSAIAPTVFAETLRGDWKTNFALYAKALNKEKEGNKVISEYQQKVAEVRQNAGELLNQKVSMVRFMPGETRIYQLDSFSGRILKDVGFKRPPLQNKDSFAIDISKEQIPQADGDILFYFTYDTGDNKGNKQEQAFLSDPLWTNLQAVKNHRAFKVDDVIWNTAGGVKAAFLMLNDLNSYIEKIKAQT
jgi:iron complex transport system substrate-binding protein